MRTLVLEVLYFQQHHKNIPGGMHQNCPIPGFSACSPLATGFPYILSSGRTSPASQCVFLSPWNVYRSGMMGIAAATVWEAPVGVEDELSRLRRGDPEALGALVERYQHRLYRYLCRLVSDPAAAEDLFQQTWLRVAEQIHRYDEGRNFDAWLFRVAHNLAIDSLRRYRPESLDEPLPSGES